MAVAADAAEAKANTYCLDQLSSWPLVEVSLNGKKKKKTKTNLLSGKPSEDIRRPNNEDDPDR